MGSLFLQRQTLKVSLQFSNFAERKTCTIDADLHSGRKIQHAIHRRRQRRRGALCPGRRSRSSSSSIVLCLIICDLRETPHSPLTVRRCTLVGHSGRYGGNFLIKTTNYISVQVQSIYQCKKEWSDTIKAIFQPCCKFPSAISGRVYHHAREEPITRPHCSTICALCGRKKRIEYELAHSPRCTCRANY